MKLLLRFPLRFTITAATLAFAALAYLLSFLAALPNIINAAEDKAISTMTHQMTHYQGSFSDLLLANKFEAVNSLISLVSEHKIAELIVIIDAKNKIVASNKLALIGNTLSAAGIVLTKEARKKASGKFKAHTFIDKEKNQVIGLAPVCAHGKGAQQLLFSDCYILYAVKNMGDWTGTAFDSFTLMGKYFALAGVFFTILLLLFFHHTFNRRSNILIATAKRFGDGYSNTRSRLEGKDELAVISNNFDALLDKINDGNHLLGLSEERLSLVLENLNNQVWDWRLDKGEIYFSPNWATIFCCDPYQKITSLSAALRLVHRNQRKAVCKAAKRLFRGEANRFEERFQINCCSKKARWVLGQVAVVKRDEEGKPTRMIGACLDIHDHIMTEQKLHYSQTSMAAIMEQAADAVISINKNQKIIAYNAAAKRMFGYAKNEIMGQSINALMPAGISKKHKRMVAGFAMGRVNNKNMAARNEIFIANKNGRLIPTEASISKTKTPDGLTMTVMLRDISDRKLSEQNLSNVEERIRTLTKISPVGVFHTNEKGICLYVNNKWLEITDLNFSEALGRGWECALHPDDRERVVDEWFSAVKNGEPYSSEYRFLQKDDTEKWVISQAVAQVSHNGKIKSYIGTVTDITDLKIMQRQLIQTSKLATLGELASGVAHELNQPLSIMGMAAETILMDLDDGFEDTENHKRKLSTIIKQVDRMGRITDHMRLFSRNNELKFRTFFPQKTVIETIDLISPQFNAQGVRLITSINKNADLILGDPAQLEQVILNLLTNARDSVLLKKASSNDKGLDFTPSVNVSLKTLPTTSLIAITVKDNGVGIPDKDMDRIFDPFFTTKPEGKGTGLGLSISYNIINSMEGELHVFSKRSQTSFEILLPITEKTSILQITPKHAVKDTAPHAYKKPKKSKIKKRILVVEDEIDAAENVAEHLNRKGFEVIIADNGEKAFKLLACQTFDSIITDLRMPTMNGETLLKKLSCAQCSLPIIVMTGHLAMGDEQKIISMGASVVLRKPIRLHTLSSTLSNLLFS